MIFLVFAIMLFACFSCLTILLTNIQLSEKKLTEKSHHQSSDSDQDGDLHEAALTGRNHEGLTDAAFATGEIQLPLRCTTHMLLPLIFHV